MRHTEFWARMNHSLGASYARTWSREHVLADLGEALVQLGADLEVECIPTDPLNPYSILSPAVPSPGDANRIQWTAT